jgi:hypothetical protein
LKSSAFSVLLILPEPRVGGKFIYPNSRRIRQESGRIGLSDMALPELLSNYQMAEEKNKLQEETMTEGGIAYEPVF